MKKTILWAALAVATLPICVSTARADESSGAPKEDAKTEVAAPKPAAFGDGIPWRLDVKKARQEASSSGKLMLLYFFADWCGYCKKLEATAFEDKRVLLLSEEFVSVPIDGDGGPGSELKTAYGVKGYPSIPVMTAQEEIVGRLGSYEGDTAAVYAQEMAKLLQKHSLSRLKKAAAKNDLSALAILAAMHISLNKLNDAENVLDQAAQIVEKTPAKNARLAVANIALADLYMAQRDFSGAIVMLEHALKVAEKGFLVEAQLKLGYSLLENGNKTEAVKHLTAAKESPDANDAARELAAQFLDKAGA